MRSEPFQMAAAGATQVSIGETTGAGTTRQSFSAKDNEHGLPTMEDT
ncbi:hypothetical protein [Nonomuraea fuscirosea]